MDEFALRVHHLTKSFSGKNVLHDVSLEIQKGQIFGLIGPNGAGKTTLIKILSALYSFDSGQASVSGFDVKTHPLEVKKNIGLMLDDPPLFDYLTVYETLLLYGKMYGLNSGNLEERVETLVDSFYLSEEKYKLFSSLSIGNKKKLAFCCSIIHEPPLLFIDEPLLNVDVLTARRMKDALKKYASGGKTVFMTSHILPLVEELCTTIGVLSRGKLLFTGTPQELRTKAASAHDESLEDIFIRILKEESGESS